MASSIDLSANRDLQLLVDVVGAIRRAPPDSRPLLVGAVARDILLSYAHGIRLERATHDIDFAFAVTSWDEFMAMRSALVASGDFAEVEGNLHRLDFRNGTRVDFLPFGGVEDKQHTVAWPPEGDVVMNLIGYSEALADAIEVILPAGERVAAVSLPGLAMLKLFAWRDRGRRQRPSKDAIDLWSVLLNYLEAGNQERVYTEAAHLLELADYDHRRAGAWLLGRDMRALLAHGDGAALMATISLLGAETDADGHLDLARDMRRTDAQGALDLLRSLLAGLDGSRWP